MFTGATVWLLTHGHIRVHTLEALLVSFWLRLRVQHDDSPIGRWDGSVVGVFPDAPKAPMEKNNRKSKTNKNPPL